MSLETTCTECGRTVGVVRAPTLGDEPPRYKTAVHASTDRTGSDRVRRPRCIGTGIEPPNSMLSWVATGPDARRRQNNRAVDG